MGTSAGLSQTDKNGRNSPNVGRSVRLPGHDVHGRRRSGVRPAADRSAAPVQVVNFIYQFAFGTSIGVNQFASSGLPVTRELGIYPTSNLPVQSHGRMSDGRTDMFSQTDLLVQHEFRIGGDRRLQENQLQRAESIQIRRRPSANSRLSGRQRCRAG